MLKLDLIKKELDGYSYVILKIYGIIDYKPSIDKLNEALIKILQQEKYIILDLGDLKYITSQGISLLYDFANEFYRCGGCFELTAMSPKVKVIFDMVDMGKLFSIHSSKEEAIRRLEKLARKK